MRVIPARTLPIGLLLMAALIGTGCSGSSKLGSAAERSQDVVALIADQPLRIDEFERQYAKTVGARDVAAQDSLEAYQDFLERWVDFRLKVKAAREAGLDRDSALSAELDGYRQQFARPFLLDKTVVDPLVRETYEKQQRMVDASHILIRIGRDATPADTLQAFDRLTAIRDSIAAGADFGEMAVRHSEDPSASNAVGGAGYRGRLGFIRGGRLVSEFEDVAFKIPIGELSDVFRTQFGYHILVVHDRGPAANDIRIAHIMVTPESPEDSAAAWAEVRALQDSLASGVEFAQLARNNSDDQNSGPNGGELGFVSIDGRLIPVVKEAAFALENIGDVSPPVVTNFGIHLVTLLERKDPPTLDDSYDAIQRQISRSGQLDRKEEQYARQLLTEIGLAVDTTLIRQVFGAMTADSAATLVARGVVPQSGEQPAITIGDQSYTLAEVAQFGATAQIAANTDAVAYALSIADRFAVQEAIDHKVALLEKEDDEFRQTMSDFLDGLLLFRVMEDSVWSLATSDSVELRRRYELDPDKYRHPDRTRLLGFYTRDRALSDSVATLLKSSVQPSQIVAHFSDSSGSAVRLDTTMVAGPTNSVFDRAIALESGAWTSPQSYNRGFIVILNDGLESARTKTFEEARTEIVNEYQQDLEEGLVSRLRSRYGARTFPERLRAAFVDHRPPAAVDAATERQ